MSHTTVLIWFMKCQIEVFVKNVNVEVLFAAVTFSCLHSFSYMRYISVSVKVWKIHLVCMYVCMYVSLFISNQIQ